MLTTLNIVIHRSVQVQVKVQGQLSGQPLAIRYYSEGALMPSPS
jgi:hypothetical protein